MKVVAFLNGKGGVGKTTSCVNVSACLAEKGLKTALLDADPQRSAVSWAEGNGQSNMKFDFAEVKDALTISTMLERLEGAGYDIVCIDTPPALYSEWLWAVVRSSDFVVIPTKTGRGSLGQAIATYREITKSGKKSKILLTMVDSRRKNAVEVGMSALEAADIHTFGGVVRAYACQEDAWNANQSIFDYNDGSPSLDNARRDYRVVTGQIMAEVGV